MTTVSQKNTIKFTALFLIVNMMFLFLHTDVAMAYSNIHPEKIIELVNKERINNNSQSLRINKQLMEAANNKAKYLIDNNIFEHNSNNKKFSDWVKEVDYDYSFIGENLAENFKNSETAVNAWLNSPSHKENMLNNNFTETGVAVIQKNNRIIVVQIFGRPISKQLPIEKTIKNHISENILKIDAKYKIQIVSNLS
ncbi:MAG TPA: CAP domain-containing protein [bacterium]|jgi:hypothetical protein|nr:CAP domain-containing protein [bacterium]HOG37925.1 CAP domain-containing protein [bacterium]HQI02983.1 CAP domain-containing protein [bacterium]